MRIINNKGFTLIELTLVISLLGLLAAVVIPAFGDLTPTSLDGAARKIKADLRYAQNLSTTTGENHGLQVTGDATYQIYNVATGAIMLSPDTNTAMQENLSDDFGNSRFQDTNYQIEFDATGQPSLGGGTIITLFDNNNPFSTRQIQVTATSGFINIL